MSDPVFNPTGLIDRAALEFLRSKKLLPGYSHYDVWLYQHAVAFTVAKMMDADMLAEVKDALETAQRNGTSFEVFKQRLKPYLMSRGWWGEQVMTDPVDGVAKLVQLGSTRRLRVIFQTNMATAFAAGQWARIQSNKKALPYLRYNKSAAGQPRDSHRRYYGLVLPVEHPIWKQIFPPNGYGCQCSVSQLSRKQAEREGISGEPDVDMVEFTNPRTGQTVLIPADITPSFAHNHGDRLGALQALMADKHGKAALAKLIEAADDHVAERLERPNFFGAPPPLTVLSDAGLSDPQGFVYQYAGRGRQIGVLPVGKAGSVEWVEQDGQHYLLEYTKAGIQINPISDKELIKFKTNEIKSLSSPLMSAEDQKDWKSKVASFRRANFGTTDLADRHAIFLYTTSNGYRLVNNQLIHSKGDLSRLTPSALQLVRALDFALSQAPTYQGETVRYLKQRGMPDAEAFLKAHQPGGLVRYSNFTSSSKTEGSFPKGDVTITIKGRSGVDVSRLSRFSTENEVLLPRQAVYRVISHTQENDHHYITVEEVAETVHNETKIVQLSLGDSHVYHA